MIELSEPTAGRIPRLVSVLIGTYNGARYLKPTIDSVLAQTYAPIEVIVVDDGSKDDTWEILQSYGDRITAIRQANGGVPAARNTGLDHARGEFIALMDHDDLCMPERLAVQVALMDQYSEVGLCSTEFSAFNDQGQIADRYSGTYYSQCAPETGGIAQHFKHQAVLDVTHCIPCGCATPTTLPVYFGQVYDQIACGNFAHPPTVLFRASLLSKVGGFEPSTRLMCDWYWLVRAAEVTMFACIDYPLLNYRRSSTQISGNTPRAKLDTMHVSELIVSNDPALWQRQRPALQALLAESALDVAYTNAQTTPWLSLKLLTKVAFKYRTLNPLFIRTLIKALVPDAAVTMIQRFRSSSRA
jgi:glycosyltransferase involved in cell wall biosynthesis